MAAPKPELFYSIVSEGSARARLLATELDLLARLRFRNVVYPEVEADFVARGGVALPAYWDGERLVQGEAEVLAALRRLAERGRAGSR